MDSNNLLDTKVIYQQSTIQCVRRWWRGIHPDKGVITWGWTGWETVEEKDVIIPIHTFSVGVEASGSNAN